MAPEDAESYANSLNALTNQARGVVRDLNPHVTQFASFFENSAVMFQFDRMSSVTFECELKTVK